MRSTRLGSGILAAALLAAIAPGLPADAASGRGAATHAKRKTIDTPGTRTRHVVLRWRGDAKAKRFERSVGVPGIGDLTMTCRPNETRISLEADDPSAETQMWMAKYEDKPYGAAVAVKTVRIYRYQHWYDRKGRGTSNPQSEGLNQRSGKNGVENWASGYAHGIISQRGARNAMVGADPLKPVTTFELNWYWNGFDYPAEYRSCRMEITAVTQLDTRLALNWHTDSDAAESGLRTVRVPSMGDVQLRCETDRNGARSVTLLPDDPDTTVYAETIEGEGRVEDRVSTRNRTYDEDSRRLGPLPVPTNGMMRLFFDRGGATVPYLLSSYVKPNDPDGQRNTCEMAMGLSPR